MRKIEISTQLWKRSIAALGILAGLTLAPASAQAQVCGDLGEIADDLLDDYFDDLEGFFEFGGLSEKACDSMTKTFAQACATAVKDAAKCLTRQADTVPKVAKPACQEASKNPSSCNEGFKQEANDEGDFIDEDEQLANNDCDDAEDIFFDVCRFGFDE